MTSFAPAQGGPAAEVAATTSAEVERVRIAVMVASYQVDVVVPVKFSIETFIDDLLAVLGEAVGEEVDFTPPSGQWSLSRPGHPPIPRWRSLGDYEIVDGAMLMLTPVESAEEFSPIVEDITDALALINEREFADFDPHTSAVVGLATLVAGAVAVAVMLSWSWTETASLGWCAAPALLLGVLAWAAAQAARYRYASPRAFLGLALAAMPLLFAGGAMVVPPAYGQSGPFAAANFAAGALVTAVASVTLLRMTRLGVATLTALTVIGIVLTVAALPMTFADLSPDQVAAGVVLLGLIVFAVAPRISVAIAHIRPPDLPDTGDEVAPATLNDIFDAQSGTDSDSEPGFDASIESRARLAVSSLIGLIVAVSVVIPTAMIVTVNAHPGGIREIIMGISVAAILVLRRRSYPDRIQAIALVTAAVVTVVGVGFVQVAGYTSPIPRLAVTLIVAVIMLLGCLSAVRLPGVRLSPVSRRIIDLIEYAFIVVVPILAFWIMGIYTAMRQL